MIQGITVVLYDKIEVGRDEFNHAIYEETPTEVENVLVSPATSEDVINELNLTGKHLVYEMAIPKDDTHNWVDRKVKFFNQIFKTFGLPTEGIEANIPLSWNKKVKVERYE